LVRLLSRALTGALRTGVALAAVVAVLVAGNAHSYAAPTPAELERQIDEAWNTLEPIIEQYNFVHGQLKENQPKVEALQRQLQPLQAQVDAAMSKVSALAVRAYKLGPGSTVNAVLSSGSPTGLVHQLGMLNEMARIQRQQISAVAATRDKYAADKKVLDDLVAKLAAQDAELAGKKTEIEAKLANLQKLRTQAYGSSGATGELKPVACPVEYLSGPGGTAAKKACELIGKPYIWGAAGPNGYDCSGMTMTAWAAAGVKLRHYTRWQWEDTKPVSRPELRPGDLVFFYSDLHHMGLYVGGGWMVHAPTTGDRVRMAKIDGRPITGYRRPG
jgi:cell wall-associated NlpC family hydrolase